MRSGKVWVWISTTIKNFLSEMKMCIRDSRVKSTDTLDVQVEMTPEMFTDNLGEISRRQKRETPFSELSEEELAQLAVYDRYPWEYTAFPVGGDVILIKDDRLAEALNALPPDNRDIFLMYWFLGMADREIAEHLHMVRRTVNARRQSAYRLLKELMGGEADD